MNVAIPTPLTEPSKVSPALNVPVIVHTLNVVPPAGFVKTFAVAPLVCPVMVSFRVYPAIAEVVIVYLRYVVALSNRTISQRLFL